MKASELVKLKEHLVKAAAEGKESVRLCCFYVLLSQSLTGVAQVTADILEQLSGWTATQDLLKATRIGIEVNALRKSEAQSESVRDLAKDLVAKWKRDVEAAKGHHSTLSSPASATVPKTSQSLSLGVRTANGGAEQDPMQSTSSSVSSGGAPARTVTTDGISVPKTKDRIRVKCIEMLYSALASGSDVDGKLVLKKVDAIETAVFREHGETVEAKYKARIRSLVSNLKDKGNVELRESVLDGSLSPSTFSKMSQEEMMS
jgi:transcription elongation factor S-II